MDIEEPYLRRLALEQQIFSHSVTRNGFWDLVAGGYRHARISPSKPMTKEQKKRYVWLRMDKDK
jgi:hypothetical protein